MTRPVIDLAYRILESHYEENGGLRIRVIDRVELINGSIGGADIPLDEKRRRAESYVQGFPDWSVFDDTDATRDEDGLTERDREQEHYYDLLDQRRD